MPREIKGIIFTEVIPEAEEALERLRRKWLKDESKAS
jgi:hypothetical protein